MYLSLYCNSKLKMVLMFEVKSTRSGIQIFFYFFSAPLSHSYNLLQQKGGGGWGGVGGEGVGNHLKPYLCKLFCSGFFIWTLSKTEIIRKYLF